jgi:hypothetical protein
MSARPLAWLSVALVLALVGCSGRSPAGPHLTFADDAPPDFRDVATNAWTRFGTVFEGRRECLRPIRVGIAWDLDDRARYEPAAGVVLVRVPGTAPNLAASLVHEFAHHLEFTCPAQHRLRPSFLAAEGLPPSAAWFHAARYEDVPSERFAEAVVTVVMGRSSGVGVPVPPDAVGVVRTWAAG